MYARITDMLGAGTIRVPASFIVIEDDYGNALAVASVFGPEGTCIISKVNDKDFNRICKQLGVTNIPQVDEVRMPAPAGSKIILGPSDE